MRAYAQKPSEPKREASLHPSRIAPHSNAEGLKGWTSTPATTGLGHDFSRISVYSKSQPSLQAKLTVNPPGDIYEQEADRVAEQVMSMPEPQLQRTCACAGGCPKCRNEQTAEQHLQTKSVPANSSGTISAPPTVREVLRSPGQSPDTSTLGFTESRFGHDFSRVQVHTDSKAVEAAQPVNATVGESGPDSFPRGAEAARGRRMLTTTRFIQPQLMPTKGTEKPRQTIREGMSPPQVKEGAAPCPTETVTIVKAKCGRHYGAFVNLCYSGAEGWWVAEHVTPGPNTCLPRWIDQAKSARQIKDNCIGDEIVNKDGPPRKVARKVGGACKDVTEQIISAGPTKAEALQDKPPCTFKHQQIIEITVDTVDDKSRPKTGRVITSTTGAEPTSCKWS